MSLLRSVAAAPADPILGLTEKFLADPRPFKVNLGVGVYQDDQGRLPLLECVKSVEAQMGQSPRPRGYLPIDGMPGYLEQVGSLVFGAENQAVVGNRVVLVQTLSGTGALRVGADFINEVAPGTSVVVSDPSWENHLALFSRAGLQATTYRYYDEVNRSIDIEGMLEDLASAEPGTVVLLHPCCHNPTGYDPDPQQWDRILDVVQSRGLVPFVDLAYQGFDRGVEEDATVVRKVLALGGPAFVSVSFSKTFSLYGERVGALAVVCADDAEAQRVRSRLKVVVRTNYSNPPTHGAAVVATVLADAELHAEWEAELGKMRTRIRLMRQALTDRLVDQGLTTDLSFIVRQAGMFSYSGLRPEQMLRLRDEFGVYGTDKGRICVAALNHGNLDYVARCLAAVMRCP